MRTRVVLVLVGVGGLTWGAVSGDDWWSAFCIGVLAVLAASFWLIALGANVLGGGWRQLAYEAIQANVVSTYWATGAVDIAHEAIRELRQYDPAAALDLEEQLRDRESVVAEHVT